MTVRVTSAEDVIGSWTHTADGEPVSNEWAILADEEVRQVAEEVAKKVAGRLQYGADYLVQEAYLLLHERADRFYSAIERGGYGLLFHELEQDVLDRFKRTAGRAARTQSLEALLERESERS
jgi:hypothetical protein